MQEQYKVLKIIIVDDHQMMIDGVKSLLVNESKVEVVGEMLNGHDALIFLKNNKVDIVITDISMPDMSGVELTKTIKKEYPSIKVMVLTMHNEKSLIKIMLESEASAYILKNTGKKELLEAINKVAAGENYYSVEVLSAIMSGINSKKKIGDISLTERELEILVLIAKEYSNGEIADMLFISERTVESHRKNIFKKTNAKGIVGLINYAHKHKLIS